MGAAVEKPEIAAHEAGRPLPHRQGTVLRVHALALARQNTLERTTENKTQSPELKSMVNPPGHLRRLHEQHIHYLAYIPATSVTMPAHAEMI